MKTTDNKQEKLIKEIEVVENRIWHIRQQEACFKALGKDLPIALEDELDSLEEVISDLYMELDII